MRLMLIAVAVAALVVVLFLIMRSRRANLSGGGRDDSHGPLDAWLVPQLATQLSAILQGDAGDRARVEKTLRGDADPDVVSAIEEKVKAIEVEFLKDAHTGDVEVVLKVRYEDGTEALSRSRMPMADLPTSVRADFERKAVTREFRSWSLPWSRATGASAF
jgi:hypothetical protein